MASNHDTEESVKDDQVLDVKEAEVTSTENELENLDEEVFEREIFKQLSSNLNNQRMTSTKYCDAVLVVEGRKFSVHKTILGSISDYFDKLFTTEMQEKYQDSIEISGVTADILDIILTFIYTSEIKINVNNVYDILSAANYLTLASVKECCSSYLLKRQTSENCIKMWKASRQFNVENLKKGSGTFIAQNYDSVCKEEDFLLLEEEDVSNVLALKKYKRNCEEAAYRMILTWVKHEKESRETYLSKLFEMLNFDLFTKQYLVEVVAKEDLVQQCLIGSKAAFQALSRMVKEDLTNQNFPDRTRSFLFFDYNFTTLSLFDIETHVQQQLSKGMEPRKGSSAIVLGNFIYLIGGKIAGKLTSSVMKLNLDLPEAGWIDVASLNNPRSDATVAIFEGRIHIVGGTWQANKVVSEEQMKSGEIYWPDKDKWFLSTAEIPFQQITTITSDETRRAFSHAPVNAKLIREGSLYAFGHNNDDQYPTFPKYSKLENGQWIEKQRGGKKICDKISVSVGGTIYVFSDAGYWSPTRLFVNEGDLFIEENGGKDSEVSDACVIGDKIVALSNTQHEYRGQLIK